jgi:hypothetical protein
VLVTTGLLVMELTATGLMTTGLLVIGLPVVVTGVMSDKVFYEYRIDRTLI